MRWVERLSNRERMVLAIGGLLVVLGVYYQLAVDPLVRQSLALQGRLAALERMRADAGGGVDEAALAGKIAAAEERLAALDRRVPARVDVAGLLEFLNRAATGSGLHLVHVARGAPQAEGALVRQPWDVVAAGPFAGHKAFLKALEGLPWQGQVTGVSAVPLREDGAEESAGGVRGAGAEITYRLVLFTWADAGGAVGQGRGR